MTLVAAFRINNVPVILGDMLITGEPGTGPHNYLPTRPDLTKSRSAERRRVGTRRKVLLLGKNFIIAFTGDVDAGAILFSDLHRRFAQQTPTEDSLSFALRLHNIQLSRRASVVGWLAAPEPRCFTWSARPGATLEWNTHAILGSGARHFEQSILPIHHFDSAGFSEPSELASFVAITKAAGVLSNELSDAGTLQNYYGYGLDVAAWSNGAFTFQKKISFSFYNVLLLSDGKIRIQPVMLRLYEHHDRYSLLQTNFLQNVSGPDGSIGLHTCVDMVTSLHDDCQDLPPPNKTLSPAGGVFCFGLAFLDQASGVRGFGHLTVDESHVIVEGDERKFNFQLRDTGSMHAMLRDQVQKTLDNRTGREQMPSH